METLIDEMVQTLFQASEKRFVPHYPWVFVRVLQKEQQTAGGLVLPEPQNKTSHEGVVLATWKPIRPNAATAGEMLIAWERSVNSADTRTDLDLAYFEGSRAFAEYLMRRGWGEVTQFFNVNGDVNEKRELIASSLKPGDHVLFPHWAGMPIEGFDKKYYRVVKECNWSVDKEGHLCYRWAYRHRRIRPGPCGRPSQKEKRDQL
jgi:co-chaperonin GroES (HSP10)